MEEVRGKYVSPAIDQLAFTCPHCDALARQFWFSVHADPLKSDEKPVVATAETVKTLTFGDIEEVERERKLRGIAARRSRSSSFDDREAMQRAWGKRRKRKG
jgi:hypothetical protein